MPSGPTPRPTLDTNLGILLGTALVAGCSVLMSNTLAGDSGEITLVDEALEIELNAEEDCEAASVDGTECEYDISVSGAGSYDGNYVLTMRYEGSGGVVLLAASIGDHEAFDGELDLIADGLAEGDDETVSEGGNTHKVEFEDASATVKDADGNEYSGCKEYAFLLGRSKRKVEAVLCPGVGLVELYAEMGQPVTLLREL